LLLLCSADRHVPHPFRMSSHRIRHGEIERR
jgi:hypothetical protein